MWTFVLLAACQPSPSVQRSVFPLPEGVEIVESEPGRYGGILVVAGASEPRTFNALVAEDAYSSGAIGMMFSGLVDYDPIWQKHVPALAQAWERSEDGLSYTFYLRRGVRWSDGAPFTADDVIFSFDAIFDERYPNRYSQQYTIGGKPLVYEKVDEFTVRFTSAEVYAPFINDLGFATILPRHILQKAFKEGTLQKQWSSKTAIDSPAAIVGTGAFRLHSYRPGERIVYEPNPHYWKSDRLGQRLPYIDFFVSKFVPDSHAQVLLFATGQTDVIGQIDGSDLAWVRRTQDTYNFRIIEQGPASGIQFIWFNQKPGVNEKNEPYVAPHALKWFQDKRFRHAIAHGLDREGLVNALYGGLGQPLHSIISPANHKWHNPNTVRYGYHPDRSRELLSAMGFEVGADGIMVDPQGHRLSFELIISQGRSRTEQIATTFVENMKALGMEVKLTYLDFGNLIAKTSATFDYEAALIGFTGGNDPSGGKAIYRSDGRLHLWNPQQAEPATDWEAAVDALMDAQQRTLDEEQRIALIHQMQDIFSEELPLIFLITPTVYTGIKEHWQNVNPPPSGSLLWNVEALWTNSVKP